MVKKEKRWVLTPFGMKVKKELLAQNMSVTDLSVALGMNRSYISQTLYGYRNNENYIKVIADFLDIQLGSWEKATSEKGSNLYGR